MATDWCICNIGTGHSTAEPDNLLVRVLGSVKSGTINEGVGHKKGDLMGNAFGHGLESGVQRSMASIPADAQRVFLIGHSRGAVLSYLVANEMLRQRPNIEVHIFSVDPVARYAKKTADKERVGRNVRSVFTIHMENDNAASIGIGNMFQLTFVAHDASTAVENIPMPGTHGSATQVNMFNPIGMAAYQMVLRWLHGHNVDLAVQPAPDPALCNIFFEIHAANPAQGFTASGGVASRLVTDWDSKKKQETVRANENRTNMLAKGGISNPWAQGGDKSRASGLFINQYHADLFRRCYPSAYGIVRFSADELARTRIVAGVRTAIRREVELLRAYSATWKVLTSLGLADRLEKAGRDPM